VHARAHVERLLADVPADCGLVTVIDGHPATLSWLGAVHGHRCARARRRTFRSDRLAAGILYPALHGIDANAIIRAAQGLTPAARSGT